MARVRSWLGTEFGLLLSPLVSATPGGIAAVLSDDDGEAVDFAHDPYVIAALDVQLLGAQVGQAVTRLHRDARRHHLKQPCVMLETPRYKLLSASLRDAFVLALLLHDRANIARAFTLFGQVQGRIARLLD